jgi:hypothetical protein
MFEAGEVLNPNGLNTPRIRTCIVQSFFSDNGQLQQKEYWPSGNCLTPIENVTTLGNRHIENFRKARLGEGQSRYYKFTVALQPGRNRLLSVDAQEKLIGFLNPNKDAGLKAFKSDDGFYYVDSKKACELTYVVNARADMNLEKY